MTLLEAIQARHSVRKYRPEPIDGAVLDALRPQISAANEAGRLHIQLVTDEPKAFSGPLSYGSFSGVRNYLVMAGAKADDLAERNGGMRTEQITDAINARKLHVRRDGQPVTSAQVYAVVMRYPDTFVKAEGRIMLMM